MPRVPVRDAYSRTADTWPRHRARERKRRRRIAARAAPEAHPRHTRETNR